MIRKCHNPDCRETCSPLWIHACNPRHHEEETQNTSPPPTKKKKKKKIALVFIKSSNWLLLNIKKFLFSNPNMCQFNRKCSYLKTFINAPFSLNPCFPNLLVFADTSNYQISNDQVLLYISIAYSTQAVCSNAAV